MNQITIDKLDLESHRLYAEGQKIHDPKLGRDSSFVARRLESFAPTSQIPNEEVPGLERSSSLATFCTPPAYMEARNVFFVGRILPRIDPRQILDALFQMDEEDVKFWFEELDQVLDQKNRWKSAIQALLNHLLILDKDLHEIYSRLFAFQKN